MTKKGARGGMPAGKEKGQKLQERETYVVKGLRILVGSVRHVGKTGRHKKKKREALCNGTFYRFPQQPMGSRFRTSHISKTRRTIDKGENFVEEKGWGVKNHTKCGGLVNPNERRCTGNNGKFKAQVEKQSASGLAVKGKTDIIANGGEKKSTKKTPLVSLLDLKWEKNWST